MSVTIDDQGWIKEAIGIYYPSHTFGPFLPGQPQWIVLHGTASGAGSSARSIATDWSNTPPGPGAVSTHILIDKDGAYVQGLSLLNTAWGNSGTDNSPRAPYLPGGNLNKYTISIEHVKYDSDDGDMLTPGQQATSFAVIKAICEKYGIAKKVVTIKDVSNGGIIRHADCDAANRSHCPGPYPFADLQHFLDGDNMNHFIGTHANDSRVQLWEAFSRAEGKTPPRQGTGIFNSWIDCLNRDICPGSPCGNEFSLTLGDGRVVMAQIFTGAMCMWVDNVPVWKFPSL